MTCKSTLDYWERKAANRLSPSEKRGTRDYFKLKYWTTLNQRTINGSRPVHSRRNVRYMEKGIRLEMTREEFVAWVEENWPAIDKIYCNGGTPSIDRKDPNGHYTTSNMQIIELSENIGKDHRKPVIATTPGGSEMAFSCARAAEAAGFDKRLISRSIKKKFRHMGCQWRFA
jgi:hypothetical protein